MTMMIYAAGVSVAPSSNCSAIYQPEEGIYEKMATRAHADPGLISPNSADLDLIPLELPDFRLTQLH